MSRWVEEFKNHALHEQFNKLQKTLKSTSVDKSLFTDVQEIERLNKALSYAKAIIESLGPELLPITVWQTLVPPIENCTSYLENYQSSRNSQYLKHANDKADELLTYVRPYMIAGGKAGRALQSAVLSYSEKIKEYGDKLSEKAEIVISEAYDTLQKSQKLLDEQREIKQHIDAYNEELLGIDESDDTGVKQQIEKLHENVTHYESKIEEFYSLLFDGNSESDAWESIIKDIKEKAIDSDKKLDELIEYHAKVFGENTRTGLKQEVAGQLLKLGNIEKEYQTRLSALHQKIESLLPQATSAGLASAYKAMKDSFDQEIKHATYLFYLMITLLVFGSVGFSWNVSNLKHANLAVGKVFCWSLIISVFLSFGFVLWKDLNSEDPKFLGKKFLSSHIFVKQFISSFLLSIFVVTLAGFTIYFSYKAGFDKFTSIDDMVRSFAFKLPFYVPVVWLAFYASKRRSEYHRLQQEYAHKQAIASSYDSYKKQILDLGDEYEDLQKELIVKAIDAIAYNASQTLDKKHGDKMPVVDLADKTIEKISGIVIKNTSNS